MKTVVLNVEAETKRLGASIDLVDAQITALVALQEPLINAGFDQDVIDKGLEALEIIAKEARQAKRGYLVFHGFVKEQIKPDGPQPRTGT